MTTARPGRCLRCAEQAGSTRSTTRDLPAQVLPASRRRVVRGPRGKCAAGRTFPETTKTLCQCAGQGGIDKGEEPAAAAVRELAEETGVSSARIVAEAPHWLQYNFPAEVLAIVRRDGRRHHRGQRQKW